MNTTLNAIRKHAPCADGWAKLLAHLGKTQADDEPLSMLTILESNGIDDAVWALRSLECHDREVRLFAVRCARRVQHLMTDPRSVAALDVAERYANGEASDEELAAAEAAARAARAARDAAWDAAVAARVAAWVVAVAARAAAWVVAGDAAWAAAWAAGDAAGDARDAERVAQAAIYREMFK